MNIIHKIASELNADIKSVEATVRLLEEGATVPFIARYRKEVTGSMDEVQIAAIRDRKDQLEELEKRRAAILKSLTDQNVLSPELEKKVYAAETMSVLEDIYLPFKPKRRTRATIAKEKGLEPLASKIFEQERFDLAGEAEKYVSAEKEVASADDAIAGARDIIAEWISEDAVVRGKMREFFFKKGIVSASVIPGKESEGQKYKDYFEWNEPLASVPSHRLLAMRRAEKEMILSLDIAPPAEDAVELLEKQFVKGTGAAADEVKAAVKDSYKRLLKPSMETEIRMESKKKADEDAIRVFAENLRQLLLQAPLGQKNVLAIDPGFRTGCKVVCLDRQGKLLYNEAIFPHEPQRQVEKAAASIEHLVAKFDIEAIAIGNGTASRETETFVRKMVKLPAEVLVVMVNESGASVYSASDVAREEFPDQDITVRGAVSIGRRMMDPLAELVKIDAKSIGVGQYQHDVDQTALRKGLDETVMSCVNKVGVELNTASKEILTYISGLGPQLAKNIVEYRNTNGAFRKREELKKVPRMGEKAFEQAAGFLRIHTGENPLDASAVHPERYPVVEKMAKDLNVGIKDLLSRADLRKLIDVKKYVDESSGLGLPTLHDIVQELEKPGRDPREKFELFSFAEGINEMKDLKPGMKLPGIVTNITKFGAFVDIGVHQDGLVHISELADKYVSDPSEVVKLQQKVEVTIVEVDVQRKRIALSMKNGGVPAKKQKVEKSAKKEEKGSGEEQIADKLALLKQKFGK